MEKKTKLITIDYDEYLGLLSSSNERTIQSCINLIEMLDNFRSDYNPKDDIYVLINRLTSYLECKIVELQKEGENNE